MLVASYFYFMGVGAYITGRPFTDFNIPGFIAAFVFTKSFQWCQGTPRRHLPRELLRVLEHPTKNNKDSRPQVQQP